jgi:hypothetical protein
LCSSGPRSTPCASLATVNDGWSSELSACFEALLDAAQTAAGSVGGLISYSLRVAGRPIQLCFAGSALVPQTLPALTHLAEESPQEPDLRVYLFDSASTHVPLPTLEPRGVPRLTDGETAPRLTNGETARPIWRGELPGYCDERFHTSYHGWASVLSMLDRQSRQAVFWVEDARQLHFSMRGAPLRDILHWWLHDLGCLMVHGAGVATAEGGVLLTGRGSSGKSTTALACYAAGMLYAGDDHVAVCVDPDPFLFSLYNTAHVDKNARYRFSDLIPPMESPEPSDAPKVAVFLHQSRPEGLASGFPLRAIVAPRVTGRLHTTLRPASAAETLMALAPATIYALPQAGQPAMHLLARLVRELPNYVLELGTELTEIPQAIQQLLGNRPHMQEAASCKGH